MKIQGLILIFVAVVLPFLGFSSMMDQNNTAALFSQYFGTVSLILMGITQLLATRLRGIETIFGPMDQVYGLHKWLGIGALATAFLHSGIDAEVGGVVLLAQLADPAEDLGELAYNGLILLTLTSLATFIPYKIWKWSHRFIGIFFALAAIHYVFVAKPFSTFEPLGLYITFFCLMGVGSYLYLLLPRWFGHNNTEYTVSSVEKHKAVAVITMHPVGKGIKHKPGQFAFVNFDSLGLKETHPYTISSAPNDSRTLCFRVKSLGSYTKRLGERIEPGMKARVSKPYGHFTLRPSGGPQVWIGGGIGITPFIAWAESLSPKWSTPTHLYYCVSEREAAIYLTEFEQIAATVPNFSFTLVVSNEGTRLTADRIEFGLNGDLTQANVYFCGPVGMRETLRLGLVAKGLQLDRFHYEEFEMRQGIGIMRFIRMGWLASSMFKTKFLRAM